MLNKKNKTILFIFLILFFVTAVNAETVNNTDISSIEIVNVESNNYVATLDDVDSESTGNFTELKDIINNATENQEIKLNKSYTYNSSDTTSKDGITINKNLTINGQNHTIDGNHLTRIFYIYNSSITLTLKNVNIINGMNNNNGGGAIYNMGNLTIINSTFTNNTVIHKDSNIFGGAIRNMGNLKVIDSIFNNNSAICSVNAPILDANTNTYKVAGGGAICNEGNLTVINSTFEKNLAVDGAAIYSESNLTVINSKFNENNGYIGIIENKGTSIINNSTFNNNIAQYGGAIHNYYYNMTIINSIFNNNTSLKSGGAILNQNYLKVINSTFINNTAKYGGAIVGLDSTNIFESTFIENSAINGGALNIDFGKSTISNSRFINNTAINGGAIYTGEIDINERDTSANIMISNSEFISNNATNGGAIYYTGTYFFENMINDILNQIESDPDSYKEIIEASNMLNMTLKEYITLIVETEYPDFFNPYLTIMNSKFDKNKGTLGDDIYTSFNTTIFNNSYSKNSYANIYANNTIINCTIISVLDNLTYYVIPNGTFKLYATVFADGASVQGYNITITDGTTKYNATYKGNGTYEIERNFTADFKIKTYTAILNNAIEYYNYIIKNGSVTTLKNIKIKVELDKVDAGGNITGNITLIDEDGEIANITGEVNVEIDGRNYTVNITEGKGKLNIEDHFGPGNYTMNVTFPGNDEYAPANTTANFTIEDTGVVLIVHDLTKYYGNGSKFIIMLTDSKGNPIADQIINITINGVTYTRTTDENGTIMMSINLIAGVYNATVSYGDIIQNATITVLPTIEAEDLIKYFKNGTQYYAKFYNLDGTPLANTNVTFNINGVFYTRTTNEDGIAKLNINLNPGEYIITACNPVNNESKANVITVLTTIFGKNVTKFYRNGTQYYAYVLDENGNPLANANVTFNIHGVFYNRTTDSEGIVKLNINLNPGKYIITAWNLWNGEATSNNITVYTVVESKDLEMTTTDRKPFKVTILGEQGKPLANAEVTFNIHGVFYHKTTDANGQVSLDINLIAGKYIITTYYNEYSISNTIIVK